LSAEIPPIPQGSMWQVWGERLNQYLQRVRDKLTFKDTDSRATQDGALLWDPAIDHPVVSLDGEWIPLGYGLNEPDQGYGYGAFVDYNDHTAAATETAYALTWGTEVYSNGVAIDDTVTSRINFTNGGKYYIHFTAQLNSQSANAKTFWFWPRINGTDVPGSTMRITLHDNDEAKTIARAAIFEVSAGDYLEAYWAVDSTNTALKTYAAETFCPAVPSITLMVKSV
jgi:hypothetical protein